MTENDYIAEFIKERYPTLLGFEFYLYKLFYQMKNIAKVITYSLEKIDFNKEIKECVSCDTTMDQFGVSCDDSLDVFYTDY